MPKVTNEILKNNENCRVILRHDNAASETIDYLKDKNIELMSHGPYSPGSLEDFSVFPYVKQKMIGQRHSSPQEVVDAFQNHVSEIST